jgi:hypothetical protein
MSYTQKKVGDVTVYHVKKMLTDDKADAIANTHIKPSQIKLIIHHDADVYGEDGKLLLIFRKNALPKDNVKLFYDNVIKFAKKTTQNRGSATGSKTKSIWTNPKVMSNIFGYFDRWTPMHKYKFTKNNKKPAIEVRECRFNASYPNEYNKTIPLIQDIDHFYKKYVPEYYDKQHKKAVQTFFKIPKTSFTTVTTNVNYQTSIHKDAGDDIEGFGNLVVIENGDYTGGETCFPQYGIGVDVRTNDVLFMDVHQWHANLPIKLKTPDAIRLSVVCYLRKNVWERTKGKPKSFLIKHNKTVKKMMNNEPGNL